MIVSEEFPGGIDIGSAWDGCGVEVGLLRPTYSFWNPVVISHFQFINFTGEDGTRPFWFCMEWHCRYEAVIVADASANLFEISAFHYGYLETETTI